MNSINIRRPHALTKRQARNVLEALVQEFSDRHGAGYRWEEDVLLFSRFGLRGSVELLPGEVHFKAHLGFVYLSRRDALVERIEAFMEAHKDTKDPKLILAAARRYSGVSPHDRPAAPKPKTTRAKGKSTAAAPTSPATAAAQARARRSGED